MSVVPICHECSANRPTPFGVAMVGRHLVRICQGCKERIDLGATSPCGGISPEKPTIVVIADDGGKEALRPLFTVGPEAFERALPRVAKHYLSP